MKICSHAQPHRNRQNSRQNHHQRGVLQNIFEKDIDYILDRKQRAFPFETQLIETCLSIQENARIPVTKIEPVFQISLRQYLYAVIVNESRHVQFEFPGNYYLWVHCKNVHDIELKEIVAKNELFLNPRIKHAAAAYCEDTANLF